MSRRCECPTKFCATGASNSFLLDNDVGYSVHLCELLAVKRRHQLPGSRLSGDEVLRQRDSGESTHIAVRGEAMVSACKNDNLKNAKKQKI